MSSCRLMINKNNNVRITDNVWSPTEDLEYVSVVICYRTEPNLPTVVAWTRSEQFELAEIREPQITIQELRQYAVNSHVLPDVRTFIYVSLWCPLPLHCRRNRRYSRTLFHHLLMLYVWPHCRSPLSLLCAFIITNSSQFCSYYNNLWIPSVGNAKFCNC